MADQASSPSPTPSRVLRATGVPYRQSPGKSGPKDTFHSKTQAVTLAVSGRASMSGMLLGRRERKTPVSPVRIVNGEFDTHDGIGS